MTSIKTEPTDANDVEEITMTNLGEEILDSQDELSEPEDESSDNDDDDDFSADEDEDDKLSMSQLGALVTPPAKAKKRKGILKSPSLTKTRGVRGGGRNGLRVGKRDGSKTSTDRDGFTKPNIGRPLGSKNKPKNIITPEKTTTMTSLGKTASKTGQSSLLSSFKNGKKLTKNVLLKTPSAAQTTNTLGKDGRVPIPNLLKQTTDNNHAPATKAIIQKKKETNQDVVEKTFITRAVYRRKIMQEPVDAVELIRNLMARLTQYNDSVQLLPYEENSTANPLVSAKDVPSEVDEFNIYVPKAIIHQGSKVLKMNFRISANKTLHSLKLVSPIRNYLEKYAIYLDQTFLMSLDNAKIGGVVMSHIQYTRRDEASEDLNKRINENETDQTPVQLTPHTIWNNNGDKKISTKFLAVECARHHTREVRRRIFQKLFNLPEAMKYSNTRFFNFIPFSSSGVISDKVIRSGIYLQNQFLREATAITMVKIQSGDWLVPSTSATFREFVLTAVSSDSESKIFTTVELGAGNNKLHLITTTKRLKEAEKWADEFTNKMEMINSLPSYWKEQTGYSTPPERINRAESTDAHSAYANYLDQTFERSIGKDTNMSTQSQAPLKKSYSRVVYGKIDDSVSTSTKLTETSTITTSSIPLAGLEEMKNSILDQMNKLNDISDARFGRVETANKSYEDVLQAMANHNQKKSNEFEKYNDRLNKISEVSTSTASQVAVTNLKADLTNSKVDKLGYVFKRFIQEMAAHGTSNPTSMNAIAKLLDDEENLDMDIDEIPAQLLLTQKSTTQPSPGMNNDSALGGEGDRK